MFAQPGQKKKARDEFKPANAFADRIEEYTPAPLPPAPAYKAPEIKKEAFKAGPEYNAPDIKAEGFKAPEINIDAFKAAPEIKVEAMKAAPEYSAPAIKASATADFFASKMIIEEVGVLREVLKADEKRHEAVKKEASRLEEKAHVEMEKKVAEEKKRLAKPAEPQKRIIHAKKIKKDKAHKDGPEGEDPEKDEREEKK